ncbi:MAG: hypothetical protein H7X70_02990, partial [Candidatus Kapabacteria bacterium]|nr:hypothetical protein [Candidatus Kapabacteria bacterium]
MSPLSRFMVGVAFIGLFICSTQHVVAQNGITDEALDNIEFDVEAEYYVRLVNGDVVSGPVTETGSDSAGTFIRIKTPFGRARIYAREISWINLLELKSSNGISLALCSDGTACLALSAASDMLAVSMSHSDVVKLWHLPDGRNLGTLPGLAHDLLVDF